MLESAIQRGIIKYLKAEGWFTTKLISTSTAGIPDILAIRKGRTVFFEVKQPGKNVIKDGLQEYRIRELISHGVEAYVVHSITETKAYLNQTLSL